MERCIDSFVATLVWSQHDAGFMPAIVSHYELARSLSPLAQNENVRWCLLPYQAPT